MEGEGKPPVPSKSDFLKTMKFDHPKTNRSTDDLHKRSRTLSHLQSSVGRSRSNVADYDRTDSVARHRHRGNQSGSNFGTDRQAMKEPYGRADRHTSERMSSRTTYDSNEGLNQAVQRSSSIATAKMPGAFMPVQNPSEAKRSLESASDSSSPALLLNKPPAIPSRSGNSKEIRNSSSSSRDVQEGLKSILFWHVIGSYQNLNKLSDKDCSPIHVSSDVTASDLNLSQGGNSNDNISKPKRAERPRSFSDSGESLEILKGFADNLCSCQKRKESENINTNTDSPCSQCRSVRNPDRYPDRKMDNQKLPSSSYQGRGKDTDNCNYTSSEDYNQTKHSIPDNLQRYMNSGKIRQLETALMFLRASSVDDDTKQHVLTELDDALDYLIGMVTPAHQPSTTLPKQVLGYDDTVELSQGHEPEPDLDTVVYIDDDYEDDEDTDDESLERAATPTALHITEDSDEQPTTIPLATDSAQDSRMRPTSFLNDEMDEFDRIFSELFFSPHKRMSIIAADLIKHDSHNKSPGAMETGLDKSPPGLRNCSPKSPSELNAKSMDMHGISGRSPVLQPSLVLGQDGRVCKKVVVDNMLPIQTESTSPRGLNESRNITFPSSGSHERLNSDIANSYGAHKGDAKGNYAKSKLQQSGDKMQCLCDHKGTCGVCLQSEPVKLRKKMSGLRAASLEETSSIRHSSPDFSIPSERTRYISDSLKRLKKQLVSDESDKLFSDLLDDLDNITKLSTDSAKRRKRARNMFSEWLFHSDDSKSPPPTFLRSSPKTNWCSPNTTPTNSPRSSGKRSPRQKAVSTNDLDLDIYSNRWRSTHGRKSEDDTDSGYHTGDGSLREQALRYRAGGGHAPPHRLISPPPKPPGEYTLTREDLRNRIEAFNNNDYGLIMSLQQESNTFQGFIRVHINLIRPINMSLAVRPPSLYEVLTNEEEHPPLTPPSPGDPNDTQIASFYLPKDTTKVIHINSQTNTEEVIKLLLSKFKITDNPRKFALYEQTDEGEGGKCTKVMRKMAGDEQPLPLCLTWGADGLDTHRFILHENDSGDVIWEAFSVPELRNFLAILDREQDEYVDQLKAKYSLMQIHITRRMQELSKLRAKSSLASALTNKMAAATLADSNVPLDSTANAPKAQPGQTKLGGVVKLKKSDVHKDTPRPGEIPSSPEEQRSSVRGKSPPAESFNDDEREPIFV